MNWRLNCIAQCNNMYKYRPISLRRSTIAVSYTHLTLPQNREVEISVDAVALKKKKQEEEKMQR